MTPDRILTALDVVNVCIQCWLAGFIMADLHRRPEASHAEHVFSALVCTGLFAVAFVRARLLWRRVVEAAEQAAEDDEDDDEGGA